MTPVSANASGKLLEWLVAQCLQYFDIGYTPQYELSQAGPMGERMRVDFQVAQADGFGDGFCIECKWQASGGSADQKVYGIEYKARNGFYDRPTIAVMDGPTLTRAATFLKGHIGGALWAVMTLPEFMEFVGKLAHGDGQRHIIKAFDPKQQRLFS